MTRTIDIAGDAQLTHAQPTSRSLPQARRRSGSWGPASAAADAAALTAAVCVAEATAGSSGQGTPVLLVVAFPLLVLGFLYARGVYRTPPLRLQALDATRDLVIATALAAAAVISVWVVLTDSSAIGAQTVRMWIFATGLLAAVRLSLIVSERRARRAGEAGYRTLIVGAGNVGRLAVSRLLEHPDTGLRPVGFLDEASIADDDIHVPLLGAPSDLERVVDEHEIEHVVVTFCTAPDEVLVALLKRCEELGIRTSVVPRLYETSTEHVTVVPLGGLPLVASRARDPKGWQFGVKYALDRIGAAVVLVVLAPVMAALAIAVYLSSGRPIFYRAERIGRDGRRFAMLKFRSMRVEAGAEKTELLLASDSENGTGGVTGVDRRTRVGTFMRKTSLDELPQLFNVLKGEMSFVGPRPERSEYVELYEQRIDRYAERHRVKSGITGWAQVSGLRGNTSLADRIEWDNYYIQNWSPWLDFKILLMTLAAVARPGAVE